VVSDIATVCTSMRSGFSSGAPGASAAAISSGLTAARARIRSAGTWLVVTRSCSTRAVHSAGATTPARSVVSRPGKVESLIRLLTITPSTVSAGWLAHQPITPTRWRAAETMFQIAGTWRAPLPTIASSPDGARSKKSSTP
jgi:hypothetical protein